MHRVQVLVGKKNKIGPSSPSMFMALLRAASKSTINHGLTELP
jgi:hypothetical protein